MGFSGIEDYEPSDRRGTRLLDWSVRVFHRLVDDDLRFCARIGHLRDARPSMAMNLSERIEEWRSLLLDTTKRNRLISLKLGRTGALRLVHPPAEAIWERLV